MKNKLCLIVLLLVAQISFAQLSAEHPKMLQENNATFHINNFEKYPLSISIGYGAPWFTSLYVNSMLTAYGLSSVNAVRSQTIGPINLKVEYGLDKHFGVGINISYAQLTLSNSYSYSYNNSGYANSEKITFSNYSILVRGNYHFLSNEKIDPYVGMGIGTRHSHFTYTQVDQGVTTVTNDAHTAVPIGFEMSIGMRFFITDNIGFYSEFGFTKSLFQLGVVGRL